MARLRDLLPLLGWLASLAAGIVLFTQLGDGPLAAPPLTEPDAWSAWAAERDGPLAAVALLRVLALALAWYLVGVTTLGLVARLLRLASLVRVADAISGPVVRHVLRSALGVTLAVGVVAASSAPTAGPPRDPAAATAVASGTPDGGDGGATVRAVALTDDADDQDRAVMVSADPPTERMVGLPPGAGDPAEVDQLDDPSADDPADHAPAADRHEVAAGEHLWSIAEQHLRAASGEPPSQAQLVTYWQQLIDANRDRLADPDNPDLIFPGQQLVLPELQPASDA